MFNVLILTAMQSEAEASDLPSHFGNLQMQERSITIEVNKQILLGKSYSNAEVQFLMFCTGFGVVNAAAIASVLIEHFQPNLMVNFGTAGAVNKSSRIGDVIIAATIINSEDQKALEILQSTEFKECLTHPLNRQQIPQSFAINEQLKQTVEPLVLSGDRSFHTFLGTVISSSVFPAPKELLSEVDKSSTSLIKVIDMEAAALGHVSWLLNCPLLVIKGVSNVIDKVQVVNVSLCIKNVTTIVLEALAKLYPSINNPKTLTLLSPSLASSSSSSSLFLAPSPSRIRPQEVLSPRLGPAESPTKIPRKFKGGSLHRQVLSSPPADVSMQPLSDPLATRSKISLFQSPEEESKIPLPLERLLSSSLPYQSSEPLKKPELDLDPTTSQSAIVSSVNNTPFSFDSISQPTSTKRLNNWFPLSGEGGYVLETWKGQSASTILYRLTKEQPTCHFHKLKGTAEVWRWFNAAGGAALEIYIILDEKNGIVERLEKPGDTVEVPADKWFAAKLIFPQKYDSQHSKSVEVIVECITTPPFKYENRVMATRVLALKYPKFSDIITACTPEPELSKTTNVNETACTSSILNVTTGMM